MLGQWYCISATAFARLKLLVVNRKTRGTDGNRVWELSIIGLFQVVDIQEVSPRRARTTSITLSVCMGVPEVGLNVNSYSSCCGTAF